MGEMLATMAIQGGPLPHLFDDAAISYLMTCRLNAECDPLDLPSSEREALQEVLYITKLIRMCHQ